MNQAAECAARGKDSGARLARHLTAVLLCSERATITNIICTAGGQHVDWTADYRLYSKSRIESVDLFDPVIQAVERRLPEDQPLVVAVDDTLVRKTGPHIDGVAWRRDPLGPAFQTNLVRGQRYLQFSAAWPLECPPQAPSGLGEQEQESGAGPDPSPASSDQVPASSPEKPTPQDCTPSPSQARPARLLPVAFCHTPGAPKLPSKSQDDAAAVALNKAERKRLSLTAQMLARLGELRQKVPAGRRIALVGDGSFTNAALLKGRPESVCYIGRIRRDAVLHYPPPAREPDAKGRKPTYGALAPTPEALRQDENVPWQTLEGFAAGRVHTFKVKMLENVVWRKGGPDCLVRVVVIAPLGYRLRAGGKLLYRQPAFLLCTDLQMNLQDVLQNYLWRWGIEVNHREEKCLIGTGEAQVRGKAANKHQPAMTVASYSLLWTAALQLAEESGPLSLLHAPKWREKNPAPSNGQPGTGALLRLLRSEYWQAVLRPSHFRHFAAGEPAVTNMGKCPPDLPASLLAAA